MKTKFDELIAQVKPLFKDNGFTKNGLNFYKNTPHFIYVVNFQKSSGNTAFETRFYVNCGIHGVFIDAATGKETVLKPKEYECYFRDRTSSIAGSKTPYYEINENTDAAALCENLISDLTAIFRFFDAVNRTKFDWFDAGAKRLSGDWPALKYEEEILTRQALNLFEKHENETGWKILRVV